MRRLIIFSTMFCTVVPALASPTLVTIEVIDCGWYSAEGTHSPDNENYVVGDFRADPPSTNPTGDARNFFVFDLSGITDRVVSAELALSMIDLGNLGFSSPDGQETFELFDVVSSVEGLVEGTGGLAAHSDLGSGVQYGIRVITADDAASIVTIQLNANALDMINSANGLFAIGGAITTLDDVPNYEVAFGNSGQPDDIRELRLTLVPEPPAILLAAFPGIICLAMRCRSQLRRK